MKSTFSSWSPLEPIDQPCGRISCTQVDYEIRVVMHFPEMKGQLQTDLEITFQDAIGLKWMEEGPYSVSDTSTDKLEMCSQERWRGWVRPMHVAKQSPWLASVSVLPHTQSCVHYLLLSSEHIVEILAGPSPGARWVERTSAE
jgi:hypothetical protein